MTEKLQNAVYTARATSTGGRDGTSRSAGGELDVKLTVPRELGGDGARGVNPEMLFAAGYSACFIGALKAVAGKRKMRLPPDTKIDAAVGIGPIAAGFNIKVDMDVTIPGVERAVAEELVQEAHGVCPYSNATRGNIDVNLRVV